VSLIAVLATLLCALAIHALPRLAQLAQQWTFVLVIFVLLLQVQSADAMPSASDAQCTATSLAGGARAIVGGLAALGRASTYATGIVLICTYCNDNS
jgi:hypothetical protein